MYSALNLTRIGCLVGFFLFLPSENPILVVIFGTLYSGLSKSILSYTVPLMAWRVGDEYLEVAGGFMVLADRLLTTIFNYLVGVLFGRTYSKDNVVWIILFYMTCMGVFLMTVLLADLFQGDKFHKKSEVSDTVETTED